MNVGESATPHANFIGGEWVDGSDVIVDRSPADVRVVVGHYARADAADAEQAVRAATQAVGAARSLTPQARADALFAIGQELIARADELGALIAREEGKTRSEGIGEAVRAGNIFRYFAGEAVRAGGRALESVRPGIHIETSYEPVGVVGIVTPWNFPLAIPAWKIAPALAFGNCVVFKPAELVTGSAWQLAEIISRASLPPGMFNLLMGRGSELGPALSLNPAVDAVSFTGSRDVGIDVAAAVHARLGKCQIEMGGKNPLVILDDADLETAVRCAVDGAFYSTGQRCTASSRLVVTDGIYDRFLDAIAARMGSLRIGDPLADRIDIGPVVDRRQLDTDLEYLRIGVEEGAEVLSAGELVDVSDHGFFLAPTLFVDAHNQMRIAREEIFGPIACVIRVADFEEALKVANDADFALTAGVVTQSLRRAREFQRLSTAGMVMVNLPTAGIDYHVPFGGNKGSSFGPREQGWAAFEFYTHSKTSYVST